MARLVLPDPPLTDGVVVLRGLQSTDVARLVEICQDPEIPRWTLVPSPYGEADARAYLRRVADGLAAGTRASFAIAGARDGALLGTAGLMAIDRRLGVGEIGYVVTAPARGRGIASRAVTLLVGWAFGALDLAHLEIHVDDDNAASKAVALRTGFVSVPTARVQRAETAHFSNDVFFARARRGG